MSRGKAMYTVRRFGIGVGLSVATLLCAPAGAQEAPSASAAVQLDGRYVADTIYVARGQRNDELYLLHNAELSAELDGEALVGARGTTAGLHLLASAGGEPNAAAGTLQGIDNVEVGWHRLKLYEAWVEQAFAGGATSLRLGLTDLNADFYQNDSAGLLIAPAFGIGAELASTGPNGPSIFPSTALTARLSTRLGAAGYLRAAVVNAKAGVLGDRGGVDLSMRDGALVIGEAGVAGDGKLALGLWRYTRRQDDIHATASDGGPARRVAAGGYLLVDQPVAAATSLFLRVGLSDGKTTPFRGGLQAGALIDGPFRARPDGQLSAGIQYGRLSRGYRRRLRDDGAPSGPGEWGLELTYADRIAGPLTIQPDVQYVRRAVGAGRDSWIFGLRLVVSRPARD